MDISETKSGGITQAGVMGTRVSENNVRFMGLDVHGACVPTKRIHRYRLLGAGSRHAGSGRQRAARFTQ